MSDFRYALRQLISAPGFATTAILTLALGIGAATTMFSIVNTTFLRPLPYPNPDQLVHLDESKAGSGLNAVSFPNFRDWHAQQDTFSALAFYQIAGRTLKTADVVEEVSVGLVSAEFFPALGVRVSQGRAMVAEDDRPGAEPVAWITHEAWQRYFAGEQNLIGRNVSIADQAVTVVGILPVDFRFQRRVEFFMPIAPFAEGLFMSNRQSRHGAHVIGRLKSGITLEQARAQFEAIGARLEQEHPDSNTGIRPRLEALRERLAGRSRSQLLLLLGAVGMLLLITSVNIANMLLARSVAREREMAVRTALGASRWQLARQLLVESILLAGIGGLSGCLLGLWGYDFSQRLIPWELRSVVADAVGFDWRVLLFAAGVTALTGIGFGLAPAWRLSHSDPNDALKNTPGTIKTLLGRFRLNDVLVVAQVALALMLLIGAGLMIRSLHRLTQIDPGFKPAQVLSLRPAPPTFDEFRKDPLSTSRYYDAILEKVLPLPAVESAAFVSSLPFSGANQWMAIVRLDRPVPAPGEFVSASTHTVTPQYFRTMGIPLRRGRLLTGRERSPGSGGALTPETTATFFKDIVLEAVVSQSMADRFWPGEDPIGKRFQLGRPQMNLPVAEVVGIVGNTTQWGLDKSEPPELYVSNNQFPTPMGMHLVVRSHVDPAVLVPTLRAAIREVARDKPITDVKTMALRIDNSVSGRRFNMALFAFFAGIALLLAALGIYGVLAFVVTRRTRELGIRMALGAQRRHVLRTVLWRGFGLVLLGTGAGLGGAWALSRAVESQLFGVARTDAFAYAASAALLLVVALIACLLPAHRATRVNPVEALRSE